MRIIVLGAGAIGSLYGAKLAATNDVTLVGNCDHVAAINASGLRIEGRETQTVKIRAAPKVDAIEPETLILLTTKVPASTTALAPLAARIRDDTTILCLQNGLGSERLARDAIGDRGVVLRGVSQFGAIFERPGLIRYMASGRTVIGAHERSQAIAEIFTAAGLDCHVSENIHVDIWHKLIWNCVVNPLTAMTGTEVGGIADPRLVPLKRLVIDECLAVAASEGIRFDVDFIKEISDVFAPSRNIVSTLQDLQRGRQTEIDYMNGAVAAAGARLGIDCPVNRALAMIIKTMEATSVSLFPKKMLEAEASEP